jgi:hypothetical protein
VGDRHRFCLAAGFAAALTLHFRRQKERVYALLYAILAVGLLLGALEEISWGQRQLGFATPQAIEALNQKSESNFHNMEGFPLHAAFIFVGFYGAFSRLLAAPVLGRRYPKVVSC